MKINYLLGVFAILSIVVFGCAQASTTLPAEKKDAMMEKKSMEENEMAEEGFEMMNGKMMMVNEKTKTQTAMEKDATLNDGTKVMTSGKVVKKDGTTAMLKEGESIWMDGNMLKAGEMMKESMEKSITVQLNEQNNSTQTGQAMLSDSDGKTKIVLDLNNYKQNVAQPAHIHLGTCSKLGSVKYPLMPIVNGKSETMLNISVSQLLSGLPLAVNVHKSAAEANVYVSCGDITNSMEKGEMMESSFKGKVLAGTTSKYLEFNKVDYDEALKEKKKILLYFYASWCPLCKKEQPETMAAFNELNDPNLVGFRVHYNDGEDNNDAKALAQQFQVPYQHTKVILKDGKQVLKAPDSWDKQRYLTELAKI